MKRLQINGDELQNGPVLNRSCTDPICCLIFVAFIAGMAATAAYGFANGNPKLLLTTWDADGKKSINFNIFLRPWLRL
jgi:solute carrier family 44 (choline transporter-like protein), member 2/4/5